MQNEINEWFSSQKAEEEAIKLLKKKKTYAYRQILTAIMFFLFMLLLFIVILPQINMPDVIHINRFVDPGLFKSAISWFIIPVILLACSVIVAYIINIYIPKKKKFSPIYVMDSRTWQGRYLYRPGISIGFNADTNEEIFIHDKDFNRHLAVIGTTGAGKTAFLMSIAYQQITRGGGLIFIEGKSVSKMRDQFIYMVKQLGRLDQLRVFVPIEPNVSHKYNPIDIDNLYKTTEKLMRLLPPVSESSEAKHYHDIIKNTLYLSLKVLKNTGKTYNYKDIYFLLEYPEISMEYMKRLLQGAGKDLVDLEKLFMQYKLDSTFQRQIKGITSQLMGIAAIDDSANVLCSDYTEINIYEAMISNQILYIALPTMEASTLAEQYGRIILADIITAIGTIFKERTTLALPFYIIMDEFASYAVSEYSRVYEQARGAKIRVIPAFQTISGITDEQKGLSEEFLDATIGNCYIVSLRTGDPTTSEWLSKAFGQKESFVLDIRGVDTHGEHGALMDIESKISPNVSVGSNIAVGAKQQERFFVLPGELMNLKIGEAYTNIGSNEPYKMYTVYLDTDLLAPPDYIGDYDIPRWSKVPGKILNLAGYVEDVLRKRSHKEDFVLYKTNVASAESKKENQEDRQSKNNKKSS
jgi:intracellular multiplication protein IcmO